MNRNPSGQNTCEKCQQAFDSEAELHNHQDTAHGGNESGQRQSNFDVEQEQPNERKIA
jgi:hypothetical protein